MASANDIRRAIGAAEALVLFFNRSKEAHQGRPIESMAQPLLAVPADMLRELAETLPILRDVVVDATAPRCTRPEGCVCGGDTPAVRAGCSWMEARR